MQQRKSTFSILFFIKRKKLLKNGDAPVYMRITIDGRFHQLFVYGGSLDYIRLTANTHHINGVNVAKIIHYGYNG